MDTFTSEELRNILQENNLNGILFCENINNNNRKDYLNYIYRIVKTSLIDLEKLFTATIFNEIKELKEMLDQYSDNYVEDGKIVDQKLLDFIDNITDKNIILKAKTVKNNAIKEDTEILETIAAESYKDYQQASYDLTMLETEYELKQQENKETAEDLSKIALQRQIYQEKKDKYNQLNAIYEANQALQNKITINKEEIINKIEENEKIINVLKNRINNIEDDYNKEEALADLNKEIARLEAENYQFRQQLDIIDESKEDFTVNNQPFSEEKQSKRKIRTTKKTKEAKIDYQKLAEEIGVNYYRATANTDSNRTSEENFIIFTASYPMMAIEAISNPFLKTRMIEIKKLLEDIRKEPENVPVNSSLYQEYINFIKVYLDEMAKNRNSKIQSALEQYDNIIRIASDSLEDIRREDIETVKDYRKKITDIQEDKMYELEVETEKIKQLESQENLTDEEQEKVQELKDKAAKLESEINNNKNKNQQLDVIEADLVGKQKSDEIADNKEQPKVIQKVKKRADLLKKCIKKYWKGILIGASLGIAVGLTINPMGVMVMDIGASLLKVAVSNRIKKLENKTIEKTVPTMQLIKSGKVSVIEKVSDTLKAKVEDLKQLTYDEEFLKELGAGLNSFIVSSMATSMVKNIATNITNNKVQAQSASNNEVVAQTNLEPTSQPSPTATDAPVSTIESTPTVETPQTSVFDGIKLGDSVGNYNVSVGHDSASLAVNNMNAENLLGQYVNGESVFKRFAVVNPDGTVGKIINTNGLSLTDFATQNGIDLSNIAVDVASKDGISQAWVSANELISGIGKAL